MQQGQHVLMSGCAGHLPAHLEKAERLFMHGVDMGLSNGAQVVGFCKAHVLRSDMFLRALQEGEGVIRVIAGDGVQGCEQRVKGLRVVIL